MAFSVSTVTKPAARALAMLPGSPWYWAAGAAFLAVLLGSRSAGATTATPTAARPAGSPPLVKLGSSGPWVSYLQSLLLVPVSGVFDPATDAKVREYQTAHGLSSDGKVGAMTWATLGVSAAPSPGQPSAPAPKPPAGPPGPAPAPTTGNPFGLSETIDAREAQILSIIAAGNVDHVWHPLSWQKDGHVVSCLVSRKALALLDSAGNRLTVNGSMRTAQKVADLIGGAIMTTRMADEIAKQAPTVVLTKEGVPPSKLWQGTGTDNSGSKTFRMYDQSNYLATKVAELGGASGLVSNEGKDWVLTRRYWTVAQGGTNSGGNSPKNHANFGWYPGGSKSPGGASVVQSIGMVHAPGFTDYSQLWRFVRADSITIDGQAWGYAEALADPSVSQYLQDELGTLPGARHPDL